MSGSPAGLAGVVAGETAICTVGKEGVGLTYRGYDIKDLAAHATFEEVAWLLLRGELPTADQLAKYTRHLADQRHLPGALKDFLRAVPADANPMKVLRTTTSLLGSLEPEEHLDDPVEAADRLIGVLPSALGYWWQHATTGAEVDTDTGAENVAGHLLHLLTGRAPDERRTKAIDSTLVLYAEHEFNASTFVARVVMSTRSDQHSAVTAAIGALKGPLHGGANEAAMGLIERFETPDEAEAGVMELLERKELIMGFGHRVYKKADPRSEVVKPIAAELAVGHPDAYLFPIAERIEAVMMRERHLFTNLDFYSALVYHYCDIPTVMFTPIFAVSRTTGWCAHALEQRANNKLIRPTADYVGPAPRAYVRPGERP